MKRATENSLQPFFHFGLGMLLWGILSTLGLAQETTSSEVNSTETTAYGFLSLLPPLIAITLALFTRRILISLLIGIFVGSWLLLGDLNQGGHPIQAVIDTFEGRLWPTLLEETNLRVIAFTLFMGAMVGVIHRCGGNQGLVNLVSPFANTRPRGQVMTWLLGLVIFFDDYANTVLLGHTLRPITDRLKISREKLAFLVDSTSAPVAGLAIISTWIAGEVSYLEKGFEQVGMEANAYEIFIATIPYRFYVLYCLLFVGIIAISGRDFGAMLRAEKDAQNQDNPSTNKINKDKTQTNHPPPRARNSLIPVLTVICVTGILLWITGKNAIAELPQTEQTFWQLIGASDAYLALFYGSLAGMAVAVLLVIWQKLLPLNDLGDTLWEGAGLMVPSIAILILAWALSDLTGEDALGTGPYAASLLSGWMPIAGLPSLFFLLSAAVSFATGTSWGTMALLIPQAVALSISLLQADGETISLANPILLATLGSVLAGAIFGDHCSPISDTTVLSSQSSGCDHLRHVTTQLPYAITVGLTALVLGTIPAGFAISPYLILPLGIFFLGFIVYKLGRVPTPSDEKNSETLRGSTDPST
ncbi:Sodium:proton antiporter [Planctomycetales bacterium 10988]|nr:Sodium:proton antiporter [Planctomycetales bacterium 10988]